MNPPDEFFRVPDFLIDLKIPTNRPPLKTREQFESAIKLITKQYTFKILTDTDRKWYLLRLNFDGDHWIERVITFEQATRSRIDLFSIMYEEMYDMVFRHNQRGLDEAERAIDRAKREN